MINNFIFYDNGLFIGSDCLSIKNNINIQDTYIVTNDCVYKISGLECKLPIIKCLYSIK